MNYYSSSPLAIFRWLILCIYSPNLFALTFHFCKVTQKFDTYSNYLQSPLSENDFTHRAIPLSFVWVQLQSLQTVLSIRPGTRRSSGGYSVESRRVYFTAFKYRMEKKENNNRYIILHYWLHLHGVFRWNSKKYVFISVVCLYHSFTDWQFISIRWNASGFVCLFSAFLHALKFTQ